jgi:leader peptidase (prepilin peptidase)/N-methyltransferase
LFAAGLCVGSFLNVCIWRLPRGESLMRPKSHCPKCGHQIHWRENIPLLSWVLLRGRCSACKAPIALRYPAVEFVTGLAFVLVWARAWSEFLPLSVIPGYLVLCSILIAAVMTDIDSLLIPNVLTYTGIATAMLLALALPGSHHFGASAASGAAAGTHLLVDGVVQSIGDWAPGLFGSPSLLALLDAVLGLAVGFGVLWVIAEAGRRIWGRQGKRTTAPTPFTLDPEGIEVETQFHEAWSEMLFRSGDCFDAQLAGAQVVWREPGATVPVSQEVGDGRLRADLSAVTVAGRRISWDQLDRVTGTLNEWSAPREVMGYGDLKLLGMIGAFLGADACLFILMISAVTGTCVGALMFGLIPERRHRPLPFGPFLAVGAFFWILAGTEFVAWYGRVITAG